MGQTGLQSIKPVDMKGKVVVVTGANTGIGYITTRELARMGAQVIMACRSQPRAEEAIAKLKVELADQDAKLEFLPLDLGSLQSVRDFTKQFKAKNLPLHVLINNAGIMALPERTETVDGYEAQFATNHLGHFLLTHELLDIIKASAPSRIVILSSMAHQTGKIKLEDPNLKKTGAYGAWAAYGQSKLANILHAKELQKRFDEEKVDVTTYAVHPGFVATELGRNMNAAFLLNLGAALIAKTPEQGALTSIKCAIDPELKGKGGRYWADEAEKAPVAAAEDMEMAKKLWDLSLDMVGLKKNE